MTCVIFGEDNQDGGRIWALADSRISTDQIERGHPVRHIFFEMCPKILPLTINGRNYMLGFAGTSALPFAAKTLAENHPNQVNNVGDLANTLYRIHLRLPPTQVHPGFQIAPLPGSIIVVCGPAATGLLEAWCFSSVGPPKHRQLNEPFAIGDNIPVTNGALRGKDFATASQLLAQWIADEQNWPGVGGPMLHAQITIASFQYLPCALLTELAKV